MYEGHIAMWPVKEHHMDNTRGTRFTSLTTTFIVTERRGRALICTAGNIVPGRRQVQVWVAGNIVPGRG